MVSRLLLQHYNEMAKGFWRGYGFICLDTANKDLLAWLAKKDQRVHGTTHELVCERFNRESILKIHYLV
jgi:hypothetical protein